MDESSEERAFLDEARAWLHSGGDVDARTQGREATSRSRLYHAAKRGYLSGIRLLLDHGASLEWHKRGDRDMDASVRRRRLRRGIPLHAAAINCRCRAAALLLDAGANVNARDQISQYFEWTALHKAAVSGRDVTVGRSDVEMCKLLLSRGASIDAVTGSGFYAEALARRYTRMGFAKLLADVRAAGGWAAYVAAPRRELLKLRHELQTQPHTSPQGRLFLDTGLYTGPKARLFLDPKIPDDVFMYVLQFWRCARDSEY